MDFPYDLSYREISMANNQGLYCYVGLTLLELPLFYLHMINYCVIFEVVFKVVLHINFLSSHVIVSLFENGIQSISLLFFVLNTCMARGFMLRFVSIVYHELIIDFKTFLLVLNHLINMILWNFFELKI